MSLMVSCEIQFSEEESKTVRAEPATQGVFSLLLVATVPWDLFLPLTLAVGRGLWEWLCLHILKSSFFTLQSKY